jgi:hypothetical protein
MRSARSLVVFSCVLTGCLQWLSLQLLSSRRAFRAHAPIKIHVQGPSPASHVQNRNPSQPNGVSKGSLYRPVYLQRAFYYQIIRFAGSHSRRCKSAPSKKFVTIVRWVSNREHIASFNPLHCRAFSPIVNACHAAGFGNCSMANQTDGTDQRRRDPSVMGRALSEV